jgi:hypothetical protein
MVGRSVGAGGQRARATRRGDDDDDDATDPSRSTKTKTDPPTSSSSHLPAPHRRMTGLVLVLPSFSTPSLVGLVVGGLSLLGWALLLRRRQVAAVVRFNVVYPKVGPAPPAPPPPRHRSTASSSLSLALSHPRHAKVLTSLPLGLTGGPLELAGQDPRPAGARCPSDRPVAPASDDDDDDLRRRRRRRR